MRDQIASASWSAGEWAARLTVIGTITDAVPVVLAIARTMEKIFNRNKDLRLVSMSRKTALWWRASGSRGDGRQSGR